MAFNLDRSTKTTSITKKLVQRFMDANTSPDPARDMLQGMINSPLGSDVLFLVGDNQEPIHAHSIILSNVSQKFHNPQASYQPIVLEEYTKEEFIEFLWFVYCQQCSIDEGNAYYMCRAAVRFGVTDLFPHILRWMVERSPEERPLLDTFFRRQMQLPDELNKAFVKIFRRNPLEFTYCRNLDTSDTFHDSYAELLHALESWTQCQLDAEESSSDRLTPTSEYSTSDDGAVLRSDPFFNGKLEAKRSCSVYGLLLRVGTTRMSLGSSELTAVVRIGGRRGVCEKITIPVLDTMYDYRYVFKSISLKPGEHFELCVAVDGPDNGRTLNWNNGRQFQGFTGDETLELNESCWGELTSPLAGVLYVNKKGYVGGYNHK